MAEALPPLDSTAEHIDPQTGRPSKDFYNWIKSISDMVRSGFSSLVVGAPVGGNKGFGSINADAIYVDGVPVVTDQTLSSDVPITAITTSTSVVVAHRARSLLMQGTTVGQTITIPTKANGAPGQGAVVVIENFSNQTWVLAPAPGVTLQWAPTLATGNRNLPVGSVVTLHAIFDNWWVLSGVGIT